MGKCRLGPFRYATGKAGVCTDLTAFGPNLKSLQIFAKLYSKITPMKTNVLSTILAGFAGAMLFFVVSAFLNSTDQVQPVLRGQQLEIVDKTGKVRVSIKTEENDETVFRILDSSGTIRIKLGADSDGSGLVLLNDQTNPGIHALSKNTGTSLTLTGNDGKKVTIIPEK
jgi:hypothetical protein